MMSTQEATIRASFFNTRFRFGQEIFQVETERHGGAFHVSTPVPSGADESMTVVFNPPLPTAGLQVNSRLASMAGLLADDPFRDEWLEAMGLSPENYR